MGTDILKRVIKSIIINVNIHDTLYNVYHCTSVYEQCASVYVQCVIFFGVLQLHKVFKIKVSRVEDVNDSI